MAILENRDFEEYIDPEKKKESVNVDDSNSEITNENVEQQNAVESATKQQRPEGFVTNVGKGLDYVVNADGLTADAMNVVARGVKERTKGIPVLENVGEFVDNFVQGSDEIKEAEAKRGEEKAQQRREGKDNLLDKTNVVLEGISSGMEGGIALPFTLAGRLTNQATPWADPPATLKDSPLGQTVFEIAQVVTPTLLFPAATGVKGTLALLLSESAIETITQDGADDLIFGRSIATGFGKIADNLGYDGEQLAIDMIEGKNLSLIHI